MYRFDLKLNLSRFGLKSLVRRDDVDQYVLCECVITYFGRSTGVFLELTRVSL